MNYKDAFHKTVHSYPGGVEALAPRMGYTAGLLRNKANPNSSTNVLTMDDAHQGMQFSGDFSTLHAFAASLGHTCTKVDEQPGGDIAVLEVATDIWAKLGDLGAEVHKAMADGRIEPHEVKAIEAATFAAFRPMMQLLARVNGMCERGGA